MTADAGKVPIEVPSHSSDKHFDSAMSQIAQDLNAHGTRDFNSSIPKDSAGILPSLELSETSARSTNTDDGLPHPGGGYGSYHFGYQFDTPEGWTRADIVKEIAQNFNKYFALTPDKSTLAVGESINLKGPFGEPEPIKVIALNENGFAFESQAGHIAGGGRTIVFRIVPETSEIPGRVNWGLRVEAAGPVSNSSLIPGVDRLDKLVWQRFNNNLDNLLPASAGIQSTSV